MTNSHKAEIVICDDTILNEGVLQFRWLQTARFNKYSENRDTWRFDGVRVTEFHDNISSTIFEKVINNSNML